MSVPTSTDYTALSSASCMARALYDNIAETPDELAFRRGDLLTVLEQNIAGCEGWWLCSLRGRQGICPGNRLRLIPGAFDTTCTLRPRRRLLSSSAVSTSPITTFPKLDDSSLYDVPRPPQPVMTILGESTYDFPRPSTTSDWYDAPRDVRPSSADSGTGSAGSYDFPKSKAIPLALNAAVDALDRLQEEVHAAVARLLSHVQSGWRKRGMLSPRITDLRVAATRLRSALHDLVVFADATLTNATEAQDKGLAPKLGPAVKALKDAEKIAHEATNALDAGDWAPSRLEVDEDTVGGYDALDQLISCARGLTEDVRRLTSLVHGNAKLLFRGSLRSEWTEDCNYVRLESRNTFQRKPINFNVPLSDNVKANSDAMPLTPDGGNGTPLSALAFATRLHNDDRALASFYAARTATNILQLNKSVEAFLRTVEMGEPPKAFLAHAKFLVVSAHRLVRMGDAVHIGAKDALLAADAQRKSDALAATLDHTVAACRMAADKWPCAAAVREMTNTVRLIVDKSNDLKKLFLRATADPATFATDSGLD